MANKFYFGIFLISAATLMLEISLTKLFSVMQFYHFAFMVVSIAMFGIASAGTFLYVKKPKNPLFICAVLFSVSSVLGFLFLNSTSFDPVRASVDYLHALKLISYYLLLGLPFFFSGVIVVSSFVKHQKQAGKLYFYNLSGAALGSIGVLPATALLGEKVIIVASVIGLLGGIFFTKRLKNILVALALLLLFLFMPIRINIADYKELKQALNYPNSRLLATEWNSFSRMDVINSSFTNYAPGLSQEFRAELPEQIGVLIDASNMNAITENKNLDFVDYLPTSIGYSLIKAPKALIINAGAGLDVLAALKNNATVKATESNSLIVNLLKSGYSDFSGGIYNKAEVHIEEGRSFIMRNEKYDLIVLSLAGNVLTGLYGLSENYLLTVEAFRSYYNHLNDNGVLVVTRWLSYPPRESLRLFSLALEIDEPAKKIAMFRSWTTVTLLISKKDLDSNRINKIISFIEKNKFDIIYLPAKFDPNKYGKFEKPVYYEGVSGIIKNKEEFYKNYLFDVSPVYDDRPFYFNFFKLTKIKEIYSIIGKNWQPFLDPWFLLIFLLSQTIILSLIFILLPLRFLKNIKINKGVLVFFFCIGIAYLFVEIVFIQKFILLLGHAIYSISTVIFSMLLFSSAGSLVSQRLKTKNIFKIKKNTPSFLYIIIILFILIILYQFLIPAIINALIIFSIPIKIILTSLVIAPIAFFMGMPFPLAIRLINKKFIPWAWATNGAASVLSPIIAVLVALFFGYSIVLLLAAFFYLFGMFFLRNSI